MNACSGDAVDPIVGLNGAHRPALAVHQRHTEHVSRSKSGQSVESLIETLLAAGIMYDRNAYPWMMKANTRR
jgi:hypothetical protein